MIKQCCAVTLILSAFWAQIAAAASPAADKYASIHTVAVVSAIQPKLFQTEIAMATRRRPENLTAYDFFLRALPQYYLMTREGLAEAIRLAHRALELEPRFGLVAALGGVCHMNNVLQGYAADPQFDRTEAVRLLRLALSVDDGDPDTLAMAAVISAYMVGDYESEIEMADRAVALNPNSFRAWSSRGHVHRVAGLPEEAVQHEEARQEMRKLLAGLPEAQREALLLRCVEELSLAEIARVLGRSENAVKTLPFLRRTFSRSTRSARTRTSPVSPRRLSNGCAAMNGPATCVSSRMRWSERSSSPRDE